MSNFHVGGLARPVALPQPDGTTRLGEADDIRALVGYLNTPAPDSGTTEAVEAAMVAALEALAGAP